MNKVLGTVLLLFILLIVTTTGFPQSNCTIEPGKGCGKLMLGMTKSEIKSMLGETQEDRFTGTLEYAKLGLVVQFEDSTNRTKTILFITNPKVWGNEKFNAFSGSLPKNLSFQASLNQLTQTLANPIENNNYGEVTIVKYQGVEFGFRDKKLMYVEVNKSDAAASTKEEEELSLEEAKKLREKLDSLKDNSAPKSSNANQSVAEEYFKQGKAYWDKFEIRKALESFTKALEINPNYLDALRERGLVYFLIKESNNAVPDFDKALKIEPNNSKILHYRGLALTEIAIKTKDDENDRKTANGFAQRALADFSKAIELNPSDFDNYNGRGKLLLGFDFYKEAIADFEKSVSIKPNEVGYAHLGLAKFYVGEGKGIEEVDKAISLSPSYAEAFYIRGTIDQSSKRFQEAIADFDRAIELNKYNEKYYNARGILYFRLQDGYAAGADFTEAINQKKDYAMAYYNRAFTYKKYPYSVSANSKDNAIDKIRLQRKKILEDLDSAIKYNPKFDAAYVERGLINSTDMRNKSVSPDAETIHRLNLALADFEQAIKLNPKNAEAYNGKASCNDQLGKKDLALADYTKAIELDPELATAYMGRMAIYCAMGKKELSIADEKKVKELGLAAINVCSMGGK